MVDFFGGFELLVVLLVGLLLFGPRKLVEMARWLGRAVAEFRKAMAELPEVPTSSSKETFIMDAASRLGLNTRGKTIDRVVDDMLGVLEDYKQVRSSQSTSATSPPPSTLVSTKTAEEAGKK